MKEKRLQSTIAASTSTFCPHLGRVIRDLFRLLHAVLHSTESLVYINYPREAAASTCLAIIFRRIANGIPQSFRSTAVHQCSRFSTGTASAGNDVGHVSLKQRVE